MRRIGKRTARAQGAALALLLATALPVVSRAPNAAAAEVCSPAAVQMTVDVTAGRHAISPLIYGFNGNATLSSPSPGLDATLSATRAGLVRAGGNRWTAYNWETNYSNAGSDYLYQNDNYLSSSTVPGAAVKPTIDVAKAHGAATLVTVPIVGYVAGDADGPVSHGGTVDTSRFKQNVAVGPVTPTPSTTDGFVYQNQFVHWLKTTEAGANILFSLDNEPDLWSDTHPEVHPAQPTYADLITRSLAYARAIKGEWPQAKIFGPASYGFNGFVNLQNATDSDWDPATPNDNWFLDRYMQQIAAAGAADGHRVVDYLDLHWYPNISPDMYNLAHDPAVVRAREQAPRSLWDPTFVENSWIPGVLGGAPIALIPRMNAKIAAADPGLGLAFTEWDYGGGADISGAITNADVFGIFGRYGVGAATFWPQFDPEETFTLGALKVFRNYDGAGAAFGDTAVAATTSDTQNTSIYASVDAADPSRVVMVLINKNTVAQPTTIQLGGGAQSGHAAVYTLAGTVPSPVAAPGINATSPGTFSYTMPAQSVSVIVPAPAAAAPDFYAASPPPAVQNVPYSYAFGATGIPAPTYAIASGALPAGLSLNATTGAVSGTPSTLGTSSFSVRASNGVAPAAVTPTLSIAVRAQQSPAFTASTPPVAIAWDEPFAYRFAASGTPAPQFTVATGALPSGFCLDPVTGVLSGTPTSVANATFSVRAANGADPPATTASITIRVTPPAPGSVLSWGSGSRGQLGAGFRPSNNVPAPVRFPAGVRLSAVAAGQDHALALTTTGAVYGWGDNTCGELGNGADGGCGSDLFTGVPVRAVFPSGTPGVTAIAAGYRHSLALTSDGNVWAWGNNGVGELGNGTHWNWSPTPRRVSLGSYAGTIAAIVADGFSSLALTTAGNVLAWGDGSAGALGNGSIAERDLPTLVHLGSNAGTIVSITAGGTQGGHVVALTSFGGVLTWGFNNVGQLGIGTMGSDGNPDSADSLLPVAVHPVSGATRLPLAAHVGAGSYHSFSSTCDGSVLGWGNDAFGQIGTGVDSVQYPLPVAVRAPVGSTVMPRMRALTGGDQFSAALATTGIAYTTGANDQGQRGIGTTDSGSTLAPVQLPAATRLGAIATGPDFALGLVAASPTVSSVTSTTRCVNAGATLGGSWAGIASPSLQNWIGLYPSKSAANSAYLARAAATTASGTARWLVPFGAGARTTYELRLFASSGARLATSAPFTVLRARVTPRATSVSRGSALGLRWAGVVRPASTDWIGLFTSSSASRSSYVARITTGTPSGSGSITVPSGAPTGTTYQLRLYAGNGALLARTGAITVR